MKLAIRIAAAGVCVLAGAAAAADDKAQIIVLNDRTEPVTMRFEYAFRDHRWLLMEHVIAAGDDLTYRFPSNIPGCEHLRAWHIADGVLSIFNAKGLFCDKRISLCDKTSTAMDVQAAACVWKQK